MNERIKELWDKAAQAAAAYPSGQNNSWETQVNFMDKFAELIVREMCGMMEQAEDDGYHCFEASERPTEYIEWLRDWQERFTKHFGVEE